VRCAQASLEWLGRWVGIRRSVCLVVNAESSRLVAAGTTAPTPLDALEVDETGTELAAAIGTLPPDERAAILLAYRDGLSQSEIAARLGWPLGTVKTRSRRALRRLRIVLAEPAPCLAPCP